MKRSFAAFLIIAINVLPGLAFSQVRLKVEDIKKIRVQGTVAGMRSGSSEIIEVVPESGKWKSFVTSKDSSGFDFRTQKKAAPYKLLRVLNSGTISDFLNAIAVIKPKINFSTFRLTPKELIAEIKSGAKPQTSEPQEFEKLITQDAISEAISKTVIELTIMDYANFCDIDIITKQNDTVKVSSRNACPTKLPWTINNKATYDMGINRFIGIISGNEAMPTKDLLDINSLKAAVYYYIDNHNPGAPIATFKWNNYYPSALTELNLHFTIQKKLLYGNVYACTLKTKRMPSDAVIYANIDMSYMNDIVAVIKYAALIDHYFESNNFVLKYFGNSPKGHIGFSFQTHRSPYTSARYFSKTFPELAGMDSTKTVTFYASEPDDTSQWNIFSDNITLLDYHSIATPNGETAPIFPPVDPKLSWSAKSDLYFLFNGKGKVLKQGVRKY